MIQKAYRYRLYPDEKQKIYFAKSFGCVRFIWN
ncbi:MAG: helix-turn-helix domain-containing protein, partial [Bulleidia sp.]|nr:helix-turn-helix domain-containing protein [Bulleidia sp.]MEE3489087.1 helix-turn-helix domain-containing protein [Bulleidia sp.]